MTINNVFIDFERAQDVAVIYLPSSLNIGGRDYGLTGEEIPDWTHGAIGFGDWSWTGTSLTITLIPRSGNWTFGRY